MGVHEVRRGGRAFWVEVQRGMGWECPGAGQLELCGEGGDTKVVAALHNNETHPGGIEVSEGFQAWK